MLTTCKIHKFLKIIIIFRNLFLIIKNLCNVHCTYSIVVQAKKTSAREGEVQIFSGTTMLPFSNKRMVRNKRVTLKIISQRSNKGRRKLKWNQKKEKRRSDCQMFLGEYLFTLSLCQAAGNHQSLWHSNQCHVNLWK